MTTDPNLTEELEYPGSDFPAAPSVRFRAPVGWVPVAAAGTLAAIRLGLEGESFAPNFVITAERLADNLDQAIRRQSDLIERLDGVAQLDEIDLDSSGSFWHIWEYAFSDQQAGTLFQVVAVTGSAGGTHAISLVGTVAAEQAEVMLPILRAIIRSVSLGSR